MSPRKTSLLRTAAWLAVLVLFSTLPALGEASPPAFDRAKLSPEQQKAFDNACAMLDNASIRNRMDGLLVKLLIQCGRQNELGRVRQEPEVSQTPRPLAPGSDVQVNSTADFGSSTTQSETSLAVNPLTGVICSGFNDSFHYFSAGQGFTGFSRSTNGGTSFSDGGPLGSNSFGDPSVVWRQSDGNFYFAALESNGLGIWRSTDDCLSFSFVGRSHTGFNDDKELLAVDNNLSSSFYGRLYMAWIDFTTGRIYVNYSTNGSTWSTPVAVSGAGVQVQGAWPTVAPNGDLYVGWLRWNPYPNGPIDIEIVRSTNGGVSFTSVTNPMSGQVNPRDSSATSACGRPALRANIRYLPSPQLAVSANGDLHVVYSYDPDGYNTGDVVNVYYRRSTNNGSSWGPEVQLNDDGTTRDQFFPALSVGTGNTVVATWYDRRLDSGNTLIDYYERISNDGGVTWQPSVRVSDVSTPVYLDPNLATCYHGDYDQQLQFNNEVLIQWADDRNILSGHNDPDVFFDKDSLVQSASVIGEVGLVSGLTEAAQTITLSRSYTQPVVIVQPPSRNGGNTSVTRITNITANSFTVYIQEAPDQDGPHPAAETVSYVVLEAGRWQLPNGDRLEVGTLNTSSTVGRGVTNSWVTVSFGGTFTATPAVLSQVQTNSDTSWVKTRQRNASTTSFQVALEEEEASTTAHGVETIGWAAIQPRQGSWNGLGYEAANTANSVTHSVFTINFGAALSPNPRFVAALATYDGPDGSALRHQSLTTTSVGVRVEEDTTNDDEVGHTTEVVSYLAFSNDGQLTGTPLP